MSRRSGETGYVADNEILLTQRKAVVAKVLDSKETDDEYEHTEETLLPTNKNPLYCSECALEFKDITTLREHQEDIHMFRKSFECDFCSDSFSEVSELKDHLKSHKDNHRPFGCDVCDRYFIDLKSLRDHEKIHSGKRYYCKVCSNKFKCRKSRDLHEKRHSETKVPSSCVMIRCSECCLMFETVEELRAHQQSKENLECSICNDIFCEFSLLQTHLSIHVNCDRPFMCILCDETFVNLKSLKKHAEQHSDKRYYCGICAQAFQSSKSRNRHVGKHSKRNSQKSFNSKSFNLGQNLTQREEQRVELPSVSDLQKYSADFKTTSTTKICSVCESVFSSIVELKKHLFLHSEPPYKCISCSKTFSSKEGMITHALRHVGGLTFKCEHCPKTFEKKSRLVEHVASVHIGYKGFSCTKCPRKFSANRKLTQHFSLHHTSDKEVLQSKSRVKRLTEDVNDPVGTKVCTVCESVFTSNLELKNHLFLHSETPYRCNSCSKTFSSQKVMVIHALRHAGALPLKCEHCPKTFLDKGSLTDHVVCVHMKYRGFSCTKCPKTFSRNQKLMEHFSLRHTSNKEVLQAKSGVRSLSHRSVTKDYQCEKCKDSFQTSSTLQIHQWIVHEGMQVFAYYEREARA